MSANFRLRLQNYYIFLNCARITQTKITIFKNIDCFICVCRKILVILQRINPYKWIKEKN